MTKDRDFSRDMLRMCGGYVERARGMSDADESARSIVMAVQMLAWCIYRAPAEALPLFATTRRAA